MKILVGYPSLRTRKKGATPTLGQNRQYQEFTNPTYFFPVVPASAATLLKEKGYDIIWKDGIVEGLNEKKFFDFLEKEKPDLFMFETKTPVVGRHWIIIGKLKERFPEMKIVLVGDHVTALPEETMRRSKVDYVLTGGDYDFLLLNLCEHLTKRKKLESGIWYRKNGIKNTGKFKLDHDLNKLPMIDRELTKWWLYQKEFNIPVRPYAYIMAARDCPWHKCKFCAWTTLYPNFRTRKIENVLDEIGFLIKKYKVKEVFDDSGTFPTGKWFEDFCSGMIKRGYNKKIKFSCNMRVDYVTEKNAKLMKKAGFRLLKMGLESSNQKTLDRINKNITVGQIIEACRTAKKYNLTVHLTMILGYSWETKQEALNTFRLAKYLMTNGLADILQSTILMPYPGTPLYEEALKKNWFRIPPRDYERFDMSEPVLKTVDMNADEIMKICNDIYKIFLTPKYIFMHLKKIKNFDDVRYTLRGVGAVFGHLKDFRRKFT